MFACMECGHQFKTVKSAERAAFGNKGCPGCGGSDIDLSETSTRKGRESCRTSSVVNSKLSADVCFTSCRDSVSTSGSASCARCKLPNPHRIVCLEAGGDWTAVDHDTVEYMEAKIRHLEDTAK